VSNIEEKPGGGKKFDSGKIRMDLLPHDAIYETAGVYTFGGVKYGDRNWEEGIKWSRLYGALQRHIQAFWRGEDYDSESGQKHLAHAACCVTMLLENYKIYPQGDDRPHRYLNFPKVGLDIDEVLADFVGGMMHRFPEMTDRSIYWNDPHINDNFHEIKDDVDFWLDLKPKIHHDDIPFEPHCYITSRPVSTEITKKWLKSNGFPDRKIYTVGHDQSKVDIAIESGINIFVDDRYENFIELNKAGICCFLWDAPHNQRYNVGYKRIKSLIELTNNGSKGKE
jgi:hypothetical protein